MQSFLYTLVIYPIEYFFDIAFEVFFRLLHSIGGGILGLSALVTLLTLPLYNLAERQQEKERAVQQQMRPQIARIKRAFKGDEQYMMLSTFYRQSHYHPLMALRSSFGLLIQIPFFIAAYHFLSHLESLNGRSFLLISNLAEPDSLVRIGGLPVHALPILMTLINIITGMVYTRGFSIREKVQLYGMAAVFLVLLYNSPSGLVLYWTMNNIFSLVKHLFYRTRKPARNFYICSAFALTALLLYVLFVRSKFPDDIPEKAGMAGIYAIFLLLPFAVRSVVGGGGYKALL